VYTRPKRAPLDNEYIIGIALQHKQHLLVAAVTVVLCTASNLAAPVLSGMLFEHLVQQHPMDRYAKVGCKDCSAVMSKLQRKGLKTADCSSVLSPYISAAAAPQAGLQHQTQLHACSGTGEGDSGR
jgi:hypothetical protein